MGKETAGRRNGVEQAQAEAGITVSIRLKMERDVGVGNGRVPFWRSFT